MMNKQIGPPIHWPYSPPQPDIMQALSAAPHHYLAIRATGSTPADAGTSWPIGSRTPGAFGFAAGCARGYWQGQTEYEIIGADVRLSCACHLLASGFDVSGEAGLEETVAAADRTLGLDLVLLIHANDSKGALGSHLDRHENIGNGKIDEQGFRRILTHPGLRDKPFVLETPVEDGAMAKADIEALQRLAGE